MRKLSLRLAVVVATIGGLVPAHGATLFMGAYPNSLIVFDEGKGKVTDRIRLASGLPTSMRLSADKKLIYVTTITGSGIEVIDVAARKVINQFSLNTPSRRYRFNAGAPDPTGRYFYTILTQIDKKVDRYDISKPKYAIIDLQDHKVVKTVDVASEDETANAGGGGRSTLVVSDDGKFLYQFRDKVVVIDTADFKVIERIDLAKPEASGLENVGFGSQLDSVREPGRYVSLFNAVGPYISNKVFGVAKFDLSTRQFIFSPIGPSPATLAGLQVAPDGKEAFTVATHETLGNKRCEFWRFNMTTNAVQAKSEFSCKSRFSFGMSGNGQKLYIYGASYDIEVYDAKTLRYEKTWDLENDVTGAGLIVTS
jgi:hypothetical protein